MNLKKIFVLSIFLIILLTLCTVNATEENITQELTISEDIDTVNEISETQVNDINNPQEEILETQEDPADNLQEEIIDPQEDPNEDSNKEILNSQESDDTQSEKENLQIDSNSSLISTDERSNIDFTVPKQVMKSEFIFLKCNQYIDESKLNIYIDNKLMKFSLDDESDFKYDNTNDKWYFSEFYIRTDYSNKLIVGDHVLKIDFKGDTNYKPFTKTYNIKINDFQLKIQASNEFTLKSDEVRVYLPLHAGGSVTIYVDGKQFKKISSKNYRYLYSDDYEFSTLFDKCWVETDLIGINYGKHTIKAVWTGDSEYNAKSAKKTITATYLLSINAKGPYIYGENVNKAGSKIRITLPSDVKNKPTVKIDGKAYKIKSVKSFYDLDIHKLSVGTHTIKVTYKEGSKYPSKTVTAKFEVKPFIKTNFDKTIQYGSGKKISLKLPSKGKGNLEVYISSKKEETGTLYKSVSLKKGTASISLDNLKIGKYYAHAIYTGDDYNIESLDCEINMKMNFIYPKEMIYGENKNLIIKSHKSDNRKLLIEDDYTVYGYVKLNKGVGKISLKKLKMTGYYSAYMHIYDDKNMIEYISIDVKELTGGKNIKMFYNGGNKYSVKLYNKQGKPAGKGKTVTFSIGGVKYNVKTNAKSIASLKITSKPGKYKITAYKEQYRYKISNTITVKHVLKLNTVKVKKSAKKLVLKATLKQGKKVLKGKKVTFKFNGKKYKSKTNAKGIVKITVKKQALKNLKVGKKITYSASYGQDTVKKSAKVLK